MVDTDKIKKKSKVDVVRIITLVIMLVLTIKSIIEVVNRIGSITELFTIGNFMQLLILIALIITLVFVATSSKKKEDVLFTAMFAVLGSILILSNIYIREPKGVDEVITADTVSDYDSRYDIILPNDVIKQNGLSLEDCVNMSKVLKKVYPDDGFDLVLYDTSYQNNENLVISVISNLNDKYTITINLGTKEINEGIAKESIVKTLTEMGTPIYSYTPDEKSTFESHLTDSGYSNDAAICSIEERNCCWYIYFTYNGEDRYVRVDKEKNEVTESGMVVKGERVKEE